MHPPAEQFKRLSWAVTLAGMALLISGNEERLLARFRHLAHAPAAIIRPEIDSFVATLAVPGATCLSGDAYFDEESERILEMLTHGRLPAHDAIPVAPRHLGGVRYFVNRE